MNIRLIFNVIGRILLVGAALLLLPILVGLWMREWRPVSIYAAVMLMEAAAGLLLFACVRPKDKNMYARDGLAATGLSWILLSLFGALPFCLLGEIPSYLDAVFETVSGLTTTGSTILTEIEQTLSRTSAFWRNFTNWIGGMGVLVFAMAVLPQLGSHSMYLMRAEVPGPTVGKLVSKIRFTARILYGIYIAITLLMILFLVCGGMPFYDSVVHSFATAGTGGFSIRNLSIESYGSVYVDVVTTVFMLLFSINFNLYYLLLLGQVRQVLRSEELRWFFVIVSAATLAITINILPIYGGFFHSLRYASFQVVSIISTSGFSTANFDLWPSLSRAILVLLMFFGACAGST